MPRQFFRRIFPFPLNLILCMIDQIVHGVVRIDDKISLKFTTYCSMSVLMVSRAAISRNVHVRKPDIFDCSGNMDILKAQISVRCVMKRASIRRSGPPSRRMGTTLTIEPEPVKELYIDGTSLVMGQCSMATSPQKLCSLIMTASATWPDKLSATASAGRST